MKTPYFVIDEALIKRNLEVLGSVMQHTGAKILLAQKCFSCYGLYPMISEYLAGATASGIYEALLCKEYMPKGENHVFSPAFREEDIDRIIDVCDHIVFNSPRQLLLYGRKAKDAGLQVGLRVNPECSTQEGHAIYDPCSPGSRLGTRLADFKDAISAHPELLTMLDGLHFHTLCEQNSDDLATTLKAFEERFGEYLLQMKWVNFGGGHHITRADYDIALLEQLITHMQTTYGVEVYLEPGEAVALNAGFMHTRILEIQPAGADGIRNVIVDTSAACHMPDVIEMPYTPPLHDAVTEPEEGRVGYRLGGPTCLSGDVIGTYYFDHELTEGEELVFEDMAIYSMVKTNTFNGMPLPSIYIRRESGSMDLWKSFSYEDFKSRV